MKKYYLSIVALLMTFIFASCNFFFPVDPDDPNNENHESGEENSDNLISNTIDEHFEYADDAAWKASLWTGNATITSQIMEAPLDNNFGNATKFAKLVAVKAFNGGKTVLERSIDIALDSALSFDFKTEIIADYGQNFKLYIDDAARGSWDGVDSAWITETVLLTKGKHTIKFEVSSTSYSVVDGLNAVYIDDVTLVPDVTDSIVLYPRGSLDTYVGAPNDQKIVFTAQALRADGTIRRGSHNFTYSGTGINAATGILTPSTAGTITVTASFEGKTSAGRTVTVHPANYMRQPYTYPGTGRTYSGYAGQTGNSVSSGGGVTITYLRHRVSAQMGSLHWKELSIMRLLITHILPLPRTATFPLPRRTLSEMTLRYASGSVSETAHTQSMFMDLPT